MTEIEFIVTENQKCEYRSIYKYKFLEYLDCHESVAWNETKDLLNESSFKNGIFSMETLVGEIIVTEKNQFDYRQINNDEHFLNSPTIGIMMERSEILIFQSDHPPQMVDIRLGP